MFKAIAGTYPLGVYRIIKCEVCNKKMAVFDNNRGVMNGEIVVLYACSLLGVPLEEAEGVSCKDQSSCYACPLKKGAEYVNKR